MFNKCGGNVTNINSYLANLLSKKPEMEIDDFPMSVEESFHSVISEDRAREEVLFSDWTSFFLSEAPEAMTAEMLRL